MRGMRIYRLSAALQLFKFSLVQIISGAAKDACVHLAQIRQALKF